MSEPHPIYRIQQKIVKCLVHKSNMKYYFQLDYVLNRSLYSTNIVKCGFVIQTGNRISYLVLPTNSYLQQRY